MRAPSSMTTFATFAPMAPGQSTTISRRRLGSWVRRWRVRVCHPRIPARSRLGVENNGRGGRGQDAAIPRPAVAHY